MFKFFDTENPVKQDKDKLENQLLRSPFFCWKHSKFRERKRATLSCTFMGVMYA